MRSPGIRVRFADGLALGMFVLALALLPGVVAAVSDQAAQDYGPVRQGDSLWEIAGDLYPGSDLTRNQIMLALLSANPDAFSPSCNIRGLLRLGAMLEVPSPDDVARIDAAQARALVEQHKAAWRAHRASGEPLVCPGSESSPTQDAMAPVSDGADASSAEAGPEARAPGGDAGERRQVIESVSAAAGAGVRSQAVIHAAATTGAAAVEPAAQRGSTAQRIASVATAADEPAGVPLGARVQADASASLDAQAPAGTPAQAALNGRAAHAARAEAPPLVVARDAPSPVEESGTHPSALPDAERDPLAATARVAQPEEPLVSAPVVPPAETAPAAPMSTAVPRPDPGSPPVAGSPAQATDGNGEPPLIQGSRAPAWAMVALLLVLVAAAMIHWERRSALGALRRSTRSAFAVAVRLPRHAALILTAGPSELYLLLVMAALAGFFGALVTVVFREGIRALEWLVSGQDQGLVATAEALSGWQRLLLPVIGGLIAGLILQQVGGLLRGRATTDYMEAVAAGDGWISIRHSLVKAASSLVTVGSGGSIGREGAMVQLSAMVASAMGRLSRFPRDRLRLLVAAGAAAGLAAAYNAPIAATLFVAEIVLGSIALEHIGPLIVAAVIASTTVHDLLGYAPVYDIPAFQLVSDWELGLYLLLGVLAGHLGPVFLSLLGRAHRLFRRIPTPLAIRMAFGGLVVGAISVYEPQVWGNGYSVVNSVLHEPWVWQALLTVLVLKMIATAATHGSGAIGGAFTPTLFVGAMLGALFGTAAHTLLPDGTAPASAYAVVGMGAMLAGTTHAPLMSILMVFELTMDYQIVLPLMLAVVTAHYTARRYTDVRPMYADALLPREPAQSSRVPPKGANL